MKQDGLIILLARNNVELSRECLKSIRSQTVPVGILVVDNASTDGTKQWLRAERGLATISYEEQVSVARAWNDALGCAWLAGYSEALVLNNDTEILPETYQTLSDWASADDGRTTGMVTCVSRRKQEELIYTKPFSHAEHPDFSCALYQRWAWEAIGGFNEECHIAFTEDNFFHVQAWRKGIRCTCISLPFLHHGSQTVKQCDEIERRRIGKQADQNRELFFKTFGKRIGTEGYDTLFMPDQFGIDLV